MAARRNLIRPRWRSSKKPILFKILNPYLVSLRGKRRSRHTIENAESLAQGLYDALGRMYRVDKMDPAEALDAIQKARPAWGPDRFAQALSLMQAAQRHAYEEGLLPAIRPLKPLWKRPDLTRGIRTVYELEEIKALTGTQEHYARLSFLFAARNGMHLREILHVQREDCDLEQKVVRIRAKPEDQWAPRGLHERDLPIDPWVAKSLAWHLVHLTGPSPKHWLFHGEDHDELLKGPVLIKLARRAHEKEGLAFLGYEAMRRFWFDTQRFVEKTPLKRLQYLAGLEKVAFERMLNPS